LVHRLPLFLSLTGATEGEALKPEHLLALITGNETQPGLFAKGRGKKLLFFSQINNPETLKQGQEIAAILPPQFRGSLSGIFTGNTLEDKVEEL
jgi:hypothetical protein